MSKNYPDVDFTKEEAKNLTKKLMRDILDFKEYEKDIKSKAACERYIEKIVEAVIDLAFLVIKEKNFGIPEEDKETFDILVKNKIISAELAQKLKDAKGMRNIISHQYGTINDEIIFEAITDQIGKDVEEFIERIVKILKN